jgi:toxin ParE1/3/4
MYQLNTLPVVADEIDAIVEEYEQKRDLSGIKFYLKLQDILNLIAQNPKLFTKRIGNFQRAFIKSYPYVIYYYTNEVNQTLIIVAIIHHKRGIDYIKEKLGSD